MSGAALVGGYAADAVFGDPRRFHPVAGFGKLALAAERVGYAPTRARGALYACTLVASAALVAELSARAAQRTRPGRAGVLAVVTWAALGGRSLAVEARRLARRLQAGDLDGGLELVRSAIEMHSGWRSLLARLDEEIAPAAPAVRAALDVSEEPG